MTPTSSLARVLPGAAVALAALAMTVVTPLSAQAPSAALRGRVVDRRAAAGIARAEIVLVRDGRRVATDSAGRFVFKAIPAGRQQFVIRALGYAPANFTLDVETGADLHRLIELDSSQTARSAQAVDGVTVTAERHVSYRMVDFERRRKTGRGQYLDEEEILRSGAMALPDLTRGMRGVTMLCGGGDGCRIHMVRTGPQCEPEYVVDGRVENMFGRYTPIRDIVGLEIYTGPSDVPGEFAGVNAACGTVVIWTRAGPTPRKNKKG